MKKLKNLFLVIFSLLVLSGIFTWDKSSVPDLYAAPSLRQIAEHWSPVIYQSTEDRYDYITNFDFDGNWHGNDNWEHYDCYPLPAYIYYSIIESTSHYIITYGFFHPRDVGNAAWGYTWAHENDFEGCRCVILKDGSEWGDFGWLETLHHYDQSFYNIWIEFEGSHPIVYVTPYKHAVYGENMASWSWDCAYLGPGCRIFPSKKDETGVIYRYQGIAEEPWNQNDRDVGYDLIDLKDTIWARRFGDPHRKCDYFIKKGIRLSPNSCGYIIEKAQFGAKFAGNNYSSGATSCYVGPPWNKAFDNLGIWFIDPLLHYQDAQGQSWACIGEKYIYNPFRYSSSGCPGDECGQLILFGLLITKSADKYSIEEGESVTYNYKVYNGGDYAARNIELTDNKLGSIGSKSILNSHQTWTIHKTVTLNQTTTNQTTATSTYYYHCREQYSIDKSNTVTVTVGATPPPPERPPKDPKDPIPRSYDPSASALDPSISYLESPLPETKKIVWYWNNTHSFTEDEHSLAHWLKGMTANAHINKNGHIEINVEPREFPNVLSSPDLKTLLQGKKFDAIRILYSNLIEYTKGRATGIIGWLDETMIDEKGRLKPKDEIGKEDNFIIEFPLESGHDFNWQLIVLKDHPNWEKKANTLGFTFIPACQDPLAQGKFLIWAIELIKTD